MAPSPRRSSDRFIFMLTADSPTSCRIESPNRSPTISILPTRCRRSEGRSPAGSRSSRRAFDQREAPQFFGCRNFGLPLSARRDVLSFESALLERDLAVLGPIRVELFVASCALDTDLPRSSSTSPAVRRLSDGVCCDPDRRHLPVPLPQRFLTVRAAYPRRGFWITIEPFATANLSQSCSRPAGHLVVQLSKVRRESQHRRAGGQGGPVRSRETPCSAMRSVPRGLSASPGPRST